MREDTLLRPAASATTAPLAGVPLAVAGRSPAIDLAVRQLGCLGVELTDRQDDGPWLLRLGHGPQAVECALDWAGRVALPLAGEADVQAACGIAAVNGRRHGAPQQLGIGYASAVAGVLAVQGLLAARYAALRGAPVRRVRTSVADAALLAVGQYLAAATADEPAEPLAHAAGAPPFTSADGVRFEIEALEPGQWLAFWTALGVDRRVVGRGWPPFRLRFASGCCVLPAELGSATAALPYRQLADAAGAAGVGIMPVRTAGPGARERGGAGGGATAPWQIEPVESGDHTGAEPPVSPGAGPLAGLRVAEMTRRLQGPLAGHLLALLGAEVVRVEPLGGDPLRGVPPMTGGVSARFHALNRHKRVLEADPRSAEGRRAIRDLVAGSDVFLHNLAPGKAEQFGLGAAELLAVRPGLVHAWASGWGAELGAGAPVGTDYLVQAYSGLASLVTPPGRPLAPTLMTVTDIFGGLVSATGVLAALVARASGGGGQRVESSLLSAALALLDTAVPPGAPPARLPAATPAELARDPRFAAALHRDGCVLPCSPWEFGPR
ncbi:CoA transferase [Kitasatospora viridis]|uniref:CoA transferase family III n=1 Tax=Kitasatospora viridis TaxID=281105 RepID=A0A561SF26_9ACTN|nr:CoA transferase [Kitasatospora viridis]TWF73462.1 CoA transferase family III [Kitasatospora viridis]